VSTQNASESMLQALRVHGVDGSACSPRHKAVGPAKGPKNPERASPHSGETSACGSSRCCSGCRNARPRQREPLQGGPSQTWNMCEVLAPAAAAAAGALAPLRLLQALKVPSRTSNDHETAPAAAAAAGCGPRVSPFSVTCQVSLPLDKVES